MARAVLIVLAVLFAISDASLQAPWFTSADPESCDFYVGGSVVLRVHSYENHEYRLWAEDGRDRMLICDWRDWTKSEFTWRSRVAGTWTIAGEIREVGTTGEAMRFGFFRSDYVIHRNLTVFDQAINTLRSSIAELNANVTDPIVKISEVSALVREFSTLVPWRDTMEAVSTVSKIARSSNIQSDVVQTLAWAAAQTVRRAGEERAKPADLRRAMDSLATEIAYQAKDLPLVYGSSPGMVYYGVTAKAATFESKLIGDSQRALRGISRSMIGEIGHENEMTLVMVVSYDPPYVAVDPKYNATVVSSVVSIRIFDRSGRPVVVPTGGTDRIIHVDLRSVARGTCATYDFDAGGWRADGCRVASVFADQWYECECLVDVAGDVAIIGIPAPSPSPTPSPVATDQPLPTPPESIVPSVESGTLTTGAIAGIALAAVGATGIAIGIAIVSYRARPRVQKKRVGSSARAPFV